MSSRNDDEDHWDSGDDAALRDHIERRAAAARCGRPSYVLEHLNAAFVLIFNPGKRDEGVYTLQGRTGSASAYLLSFEQMDDASRFAELLQAEGFDLATPHAWDCRQLEAFCDAGEFEVSLVPTGALITPPSKNEYDLDAFEQLNQPPAQRLDSGNGFGRDPSTQVDKYAQQRAALERLFREGSDGPDGPGGFGGFGGPPMM